MKREVITNLAKLYERQEWLQNELKHTEGQIAILEVEFVGLLELDKVNAKLDKSISTFDIEPKEAEIEIKPVEIAEVSDADMLNQSIVAFQRKSAISVLDAISEKDLRRFKCLTDNPDFAVFKVTKHQSMIFNKFSDRIYTHMCKPVERERTEDPHIREIELERREDGSIPNPFEDPSWLEAYNNRVAEEAKGPFNDPQLDKEYNDLIMYKRN